MKLSDDKQEIVRRHNKVVYHDGDRIVKVFVPTKPAYDVFREALNLARIYGIGISTPRVREVSEVEDGSWALSADYFPGTTMHELMVEAQGTEKFEDLLEQFVDLQIKVQQTPAPAALTTQRDKIIRMVGRVKDLDPSVRYDLQMRADRLRGGTAICHGDFNPTNVVIGEDGTPFVCDWTHVTVGQPAADAAMTYMLLTTEFPEAADRYLDLFSRKADVPKQQIFYWLPVIAAAELSRGRKGNEEFLKSWIDVANDYE